MNVHEPKAMLSVKDELMLVGVGDSVDMLQVIAIEAPELTMQFGDEELKMDLFQQEWHHTPRPVSNSSPAKPGVPSHAHDLTSSTEKAHTLATDPIPGLGASATNMPGLPTAAAGGPTIPGLGTPPGNGIPDMQGAGPENAPGMAGDTSATPGLPGMGGQDPHAAGGGIPGMPGLPGLGGQTSGASSGMPGMPGLGGPGLPGQGTDDGQSDSAIGPPGGGFPGP